jgi:hypothetical protein
MQPEIALFGLTAGAAASWAFAQLRVQFPTPTLAQWKSSSKVLRFFYSALWAPKFARYTVFILSFVISLLFTGASALITGEDFAPLFSATISIWMSQIIHAAQLSSKVHLEEESP